MLDLYVGNGGIKASVFLGFGLLWITVGLFIYISLRNNQNYGWPFLT